MGPWERVRERSSFLESEAQRIRPSNADGSVAKLWVVYSDAISYARCGCGSISAMSLAGGDIPYYL